MFSFLKKKEAEPIFYDLDLGEAHNKVFDFFQNNCPQDLEEAKEEFIQMTGPFDEEHEYFESKLDDFRSWFLFFYGGRKFKNLEKVKDDEELRPCYELLTSGNYSIYKITKVKGSLIDLLDLFSLQKYRVDDALASLSLERGGCIQTALFYAGEQKYNLGLSLIVHPFGSCKYISKKIKKMRNKKNTLEATSFECFIESLIKMRYQFFKYKQLEVDQIYSDRSILLSKEP